MVDPSPSRASADEAELLSMAAVRFVRVQARVLSDLDESLTYPQFITLERIGRGHRSVAALADVARLTLPTVSQSVEGLVRRGLVSRSQDDKDRRQTVLSLTAAGTAAVKTAADALRELVDDFTARFPGDDLETVRNVLVTLRDWADDEFDRRYASES